jgi:hypothetical protein
MRPTLVLGALLLSFLLSPVASAQSACAQCRRDAMEERARCEAMSGTQAERSRCGREFADLDRDCASRVCSQEAETRIALRCADCRGSARAEAERCQSFTLGSEPQVACAQKAGDMLLACEARTCRSP